MKILELFSGIGGFAKGFQQAGFEFSEHYFSEIDKYAIANYKYNFPNAKHIGSVTDITNGSLRGIDIITFGSPCQDFSLAGKRKGLEGDRSSLIREAIRLVTDIRPGIFIWENVKGAFSSNAGEDFWAIIQAFTNIGGYRLEWQLLNTKWFLPQNRERIYLIGHLAGASEPRVFPIGEVHSNSNIREEEEFRNYSRTITARYFASGTTGSFLKVKQGDDYRIRRLTEIECERLQGLPDDWTKYGNFDGTIKEISKTQRYKMIGNAVTVNVVEEIAKKLKNNLK